MGGKKGALYTDIKKTDVHSGLLPYHWLFDEDMAVLFKVPNNSAGIPLNFQ